MSNAPESYDPQFFAKIAAVEDRHFWFGARNRVIGAAARNVVRALPPGYRVLEVGCGTGFVLRQLVTVCAHGEVIGMDLYPEAVGFASRRAGCPVIVGDVLNPPALGRFDVLGLFDVLEHLPDDRGILRGMNRLLKPGGSLLLTVPAHMSLWSYFDTSARHCRRYEQPELAEKIAGAGFRVDYLTDFMFGIFPLVWLGRRLKGGTRTMDNRDAAAKSSDELKIVAGLNGLLKLLLRAEPSFVARGRKLPFGTSMLAVAHKETDV